MTQPNEQSKKYEVECLLHIYNGASTTVSKRLITVEAESKESAENVASEKMQSEYKRSADWSLSGVAFMSIKEIVPNEQKEKWILASVPNELFDEAKQIYYNAPSSSMRFFGHDPLELLESQLQQTREELELKESEYQSVVKRYGDMAREFQQVKAEMNLYKDHLRVSNEQMMDQLTKNQNLRDELSAKDKVLKHYSDVPVLEWTGDSFDIGEQARTILSQYSKETFKPKCPKCGTEKVAQHPSLEQYLCQPCKYVFNGRELDDMPKITKLCDQDIADQYLAELSEEVKE